MEPLSILIIGFLLGGKHAFDADHLVAVSTLLTHNRAALLLLVVASSPSVMTGLVYVLTFGCGSILGMGAVSVLMSAFFSLAAPRTQGLNPSIHVGVGGGRVWRWDSGLFSKPVL